METLPQDRTMGQLYQTPATRAQAVATRSRRRAAGRYATNAQKAAFAKAMGRNGRKSLTIEEMGLLATHPHLAPSQRAEYAEMAQAAIESAVR